MQADQGFLSHLVDSGTVTVVMEFFEKYEVSKDGVQYYIFGIIQWYLLWK